MIIFEIINNIDEEVFNRLYDESISDMEAGSFPFNVFAASTPEEKRALVRESFEGFLNEENKIVLYVREDDRILMLSAGTLEENHFHWTIGLMGTNINGSKSWLYHPEYSAARDQFWINNNINSITIETMGSNTAMHDHIINAVNANTVIDNLEEHIDKELIENQLSGTDLFFVVPE